MSNPTVQRRLDGKFVVAIDAGLRRGAERIGPICGTPKGHCEKPDRRSYERANNDIADEVEVQPDQ